MNLYPINIFSIHPQFNCNKKFIWFINFTLMRRLYRITMSRYSSGDIIVVVVNPK